MGNLLIFFSVIPDSLVYYIETEDFYQDLKENPILLDRMDTANLPTVNSPVILSNGKKYLPYLSNTYKIYLIIKLIHFTCFIHNIFFYLNSKQNYYYLIPSTSYLVVSTSSVQQRFSIGGWGSRAPR